jgi:biotin transport system substrate-specific component
LLKLLRILLVTSLTALGAFVVLPLPYLVWGSAALPGAVEAFSWSGLSGGLFHPSAQLLGLWLAGCWLGSRAGVTSMVLYLALGAFALPVFIDGGGVDYARHGAFLPLLAFPPAAWLVARVRGDGSGHRTFWGLFAATVLVSAAAVVGNMTGTRLWLDGRQWLTFAVPQLQALGGWLAMMGIFALAASVLDRLYRAWLPPAPAAEPEEESVPEEEPIHPPLPAGRPREPRALPPAIDQNARRLSAPPTQSPPRGR